MSEFSYNSVIDIERAINALQTKRANLVIEKKGYEISIKNNPDLNKKIWDIDLQMSKIKEEIRNKETLKLEIKNELKSSENSETKAKLFALKDQYIKFSNDKTRVNQMRIMAKTFADELDAVIKSIK